MNVSRRLKVLERRHVPGWSGYPRPAFNDEHLAETCAVLIEALGAAAVLAEVERQSGSEVSPEPAEFIRSQAAASAGAGDLDGAVP